MARGIQRGLLPSSSRSIVHQVFFILLKKKKNLISTSFDNFGFDLNVLVDSVRGCCQLERGSASC